MVDGGRMGRQKHTIHGLVEFDITQPREKIRQYRQNTGEALSFSAFFLYCLGKAIDEDRQMQAYRDALAVIFPAKRIESALLYTAGPRLIAID